MDGGAGDAVALRHLTEAVALLAIPQDGNTIKFKRLTADVTALEPGAAHAGAHPLDDQIAFEFCDRSDDEGPGSLQEDVGSRSPRQSLRVSSAQVSCRLSEQTFFTCVRNLVETEAYMRIFVVPSSQGCGFC